MPWWYSTYGRVALDTLVLLLAMPIILYITPLPLMYCAFFVPLALFFLYALQAYGFTCSKVTPKGRLMYMRQLMARCAVAVALAQVVGLISAKVFFQYDFSALYIFIQSMCNLVLLFVAHCVFAYYAHTRSVNLALLIQRIPFAQMAQFEDISLKQDKSCWQGQAKRYFDMIGSVSLLAMFSPFMLLIGFCIALDSKGAIFYKQQRVGKGGKIFTLYKFRSMHDNAEQHGAVWASANDSRTTRVGKVLRALHLDELPQLWNVVKNDMSFVGPRPERHEFVQKLAENMPAYALRHVVKPGLTGLAQINYPYGASEQDALRKLEYDVFYVCNMSGFLDMQIMLMTLGAVFFPPHKNAT